MMENDFDLKTVISFISNKENRIITFNGKRTNES
jgi:hypothetical protein